MFIKKDTKEKTEEVRNARNEKPERRKRLKGRGNDSKGRCRVERQTDKKGKNK